MALGSTHPPREMSKRNIYWRQRRPVRRADNLTIFMSQLSRKLGASASWNPQGLSRPLQRLLYLYLYFSLTERLPVLKTDSLPQSSADVMGLYIYAQGYTKV